MKKYIFKLSGHYLGFIENDIFFHWNGQYLGWQESGYIWDTYGQFRGEIKEIDGHFYILKNMYALPPLPKVPRQNPLPTISLPPPQNFIPPVTSEIGWVDGY